MKNLKSLTIILLFFLFNINQAVSLEKIVFFDLDYVVSKSKAGANISKKLEKQNKKNIDVLNKEQEKLKKELEDIKKVQNIIDKKELEKKIKTHNGNVKNFNQKKKELSNNLTQQKKKEILQLINKINPILEEYMKANSIDFILSKQGVYLSKTSYDITQEILEIVNKKIK
jgi:outer membrane protein|tara:strand:- start:717 stop:1229 length:513 start_codon:yes stop_codon:yes gene_type:complete